MAANMTMKQSPVRRWMRWLVWGGATGLLLLPLVAMQFDGSGVNWAPVDFLIMGGMLGMACAAFELAVRVAHSNLYVVAAGVGVATAFLTTWINLAVGIIGGENNPANAMFFGVLLVALVGVLLSRLKPSALCRAMTVTAVAQALVAVIAFLFFNVPGHPEGHLLSSFLAVMWMTSALLFRSAAEREAGVECP